MRIIGLTGGIACGKSNISAVLSELGATIIDGDKLSRELTAPNGAALPAICTAFGDALVDESGILDRKALGKMIFESKEARTKLNAIMQPMILHLIHERITIERESNEKICVLDMPLLFEEQLDRLCDTVWCAFLPETLQLQRLMSRDQCTEEEARSRIHAQMPVEEKASRSNIVIDTSGTIEQTRAKIPALYRAELEKEAAK